MSRVKGAEHDRTAGNSPLGAVPVEADKAFPNDWGPTPLLLGKTQLTSWETPRAFLIVFSTAVVVCNRLMLRAGREAQSHSYGTRREGSGSRVGSFLAVVTQVIPTRQLQRYESNPVYCCSVRPSSVRLFGSTRVDPTCTPGLVCIRATSTAQTNKQ